MKKLIIWAMLMFGFCSGMKAQEMAMRILVVDEWNRPLQGVAMHINGNDKETFLSDKEGVIGLMLISRIRNMGNGMVIFIATVLWPNPLRGIFLKDLSIYLV